MDSIIKFLKSKYSKPAFLGLLLSLIFSFENCGNPVGFKTQASSSNAAGSIGTTAAIKAAQPALAVRDVSCLMCHANIKANVITDFGYGNNWFLGGTGIASTGVGSYHYSAVTWQSLQNITGQVFVPDVMAPAAAVQTALNSTTAASIPLASYLTMTNTVDFSSEWAYSFWNRSAPTDFGLSHYVTPGASLSPVVAKSTIYIGSPTASQILNLVASENLPSSSVWVQGVNSSINGISGLSVQQGMNGVSYVKNTGPVSCSGQDVVINGTLLLDSAQIYAENSGCRLYVTGPVFVEGPITYLNSGSTTDPTDNLQISSAVSVIFGVGLTGNVVDGAGNVTSTTPLQNRLTGDSRGNLYVRSASTDAAYSAMAASIMTAANNIGGTLLQDASITAGAAKTGNSAATSPQVRVSIDYTHLLINAPMVHSRYLGTTSGIIIAETGVFSLGEFSYAFDQVFGNVSVLPAFPNQDVLCSQSSGSCNPINP